MSYSIKQNSRLQHLSSLKIFQPPSDRIRKTSIICTIGPDSNNVEIISKLISAGMNIMRLNFSHGTHEWHSSAIKNLRTFVKNTPEDGRPVAIALDTKGPEIRTGTVPNNPITYKYGTIITVSTDIKYESSQTDTLLFSNYPKMVHQLQVGRIIAVDDGLLPLEVVEISADKTSLKAKVLNSHSIVSKRHINLPGSSVDLPAVSEKDIADLKFGVQQKVDIIFASFIRSARDIVEIRKVLGEEGKYIKIVAKIENQEGLSNFDEIIREADGIMVARGDLGIEIPQTKVFLAQKMMIAKAKIAGKPIICATQMLESMMNNPRPLRAEITDVANAVLDGADCVMLSGETASGKYPSETVRIMNDICVEAENAIDYFNNFIELQKMSPSVLSVTESIATSAVNASLFLKATAIICLSFSGTTAALISKYRPQCPIICICKEEYTARQLHLFRGTFPYSYPQENTDTKDWVKDANARKRYAIIRARCDNILSNDNHDEDIVVWIWGSTWGRGHSNVMRVGAISDILVEPTVKSAVDAFKAVLHRATTK